MPRPIIVWFRSDLRLRDNRALLRAVDTGAPIIPVYVLDDEQSDHWRTGSASRWWLHHSLAALAGDLQTLGSRLILRRGNALTVLAKLAIDCKATAVHASRAYQPWAGQLETGLKQRLEADGVDFRRFSGSLLFEPEAVRTKDGRPFKVYSPFWRAAMEPGDPPRPEPAPRALAAPARWPASDDLNAWRLCPEKPDWAAGWPQHWLPGEAHSQERLKEFLRSSLTDYATDRDRPDRPATSRLSPRLAFGELSPATIWHEALAAARGKPELAAGLSKFCKEIGWREFSYHLLWHFPNLPDAPFRPEFEKFPWLKSSVALRAWQRGQTGFPIVDAGMRELWQTGYMHNRVRMIAASFLIKDLMLPWQQGEAWFWDTLVDADLASNAASWQWVAGCGADAAPYFRVFNPALQGEKFDPNGVYVRRWVPELARLPHAYIHRPATAPSQVLGEAGVELGHTYPRPIVDHAEARERALLAFKGLKAVV